MADALDFINWVRIRDLTVNNANRDMQYDLDKRAERMERRTGTRPMDWEEFKEANPAPEAESTLEHAAKYTLIGAIAGGILIPAAAAIMAIGSTMAAPVTLTLVAFGAAFGGAAGLLGGLVDDQQPDIRKEQLGKYKEYLDHFEVTHAHSKAKEHAPDVAAEHHEPDTKWRDHAKASKEAGKAAAATVA